MFKTKKLWLLGLLLLAACSSPDGNTVIPFPLGGGGGGGSSSGGSVWPGSAAAPAEPILPPIYEAKWDRPAGDFEQHGATGPAGCQEMAKRFKKEGRQVTLRHIIKNYLNGGGGVLTHLCLFDGQDAQVTEVNVYEDYRYNSPDEYASP